jgi:predicted translin family RNA/ssDNA-binding protein
MNMNDLWLQLTKQLEEQIKLEDDRYRKASERSWEINAALVRCEMAHDASISNISRDATISKEEAALDELVQRTVLAPDMYNNIVHDDNSDTNTTIEGEIIVHPRAPRLGSLGNKMEDYARYKAFHHFLAEEKLLSPNAACFVAMKDDIPRNILTDEEYIGGACIGLCHDLAKYGVTRAFNAAEDTTVVPFIQRVRNVVSLILEELLQFDFRNGPLRRKYDSTKYALKAIETVLYELSVAGVVGGHSSLVVRGGNTDNAGATKKMKLDDNEEGKTSDEVAMQDGDEDSSPIPRKEIGDIRERLDHRDKLRENLIKSCRDGQKAAKQAIFALHRGDARNAWKLLADCEQCIKTQLLPILEEEPTLRYGSFSGVLEEYVEGVLFHTWLHGIGDIGKGGKGTNQPAGKVLLPNEFSLKISTEDYLGGLCDLTGEIGRFAIARGTVRDKEGVKLCLESNKSIFMTLKMLGRLPKNVSKKVSAVSSSVDKLERVLYEQSLMEMTGRKEFSSSVEEHASGFENDAEDN